MKRFFLLLINMGWIGVAISQPRLSLSGKVTNVVTGAPLPGASVSFPDLKRGAAADNNGHYLITHLAAGKYLVEVTHLGFAPRIETVEIQANTNRDFQLNPSFIENEAVTVTGVSSATSTRRTPVPVSIVRKADLQSQPASNLVDQLAKLPGISQVSTGPSIGKPFIRGLGYNRVVVVHDGVRQEGQQWGDEHGLEVDELNVKKVEIFKGPASLMYGSDALAGVINIISTQPVPDAKVRGEISGGWQSNNRQRSVHGELGGNRNGFLWGGHGSIRAAADYRNRADGYVFNSKFRERSFGAYTGLNKNWGFTHLYFSYFHQEPGLIEGERDEQGRFLKLIDSAGFLTEAAATNTDFKTTRAFIPLQEIRHLKYGADNSFRIGRDRLALVLGYQQNLRKEFADVLEPQTAELVFDLGTFSYNIQYHRRELGKWRLTAGANGMYQSNSNRGAEAVIPDHSLFDIGGFLYAQNRSEDFVFSGGLRVDNRSVHSDLRMDGPDVKFPAFRANFVDVSGSAGVVFTLDPELTLKLNAARGYRAPNISELSANGVHEGSFQYIYGHRGLKPESSLQIDAGLLVNSDHVSFELNAFYNRVSNYIFLRKLKSVNGGDSIITVGGDDFSAFRYNQKQAGLFGLELILDIHPHPLDWLHVENSLSWVRGKFSEAEDGSRNLPLIPAPRLMNEIEVDLLKEGKLLRNVFARVELENVFAQNKPFTGYNTETLTVGYSLLHAAIGGELTSRGRTIAQLVLAGNNLIDRSYQSHLSRLKYAPENPATSRAGIFNMGRNFSVKLVLPVELSKGK
ncbi:MAG TPA: TonB-dependent receptor [Chitinophagaceae bacterium]|nr:TonB-dependent receptor [Chitinophagaceae bacterium]